jgi:uncharacterized membrane protein YbhN (UPF0104 family)
VRWAVIGVALVVLAIEASLVWDQLAKAWMSLLSANWWWVLAAVFAAMMSMHSFAQSSGRCCVRPVWWCGSGARGRLTLVTR